MSRSRGTVRSKREDDILLAAPACWKGCIIVLAVVLTSCFVISSPLSAAHTETTVERLRSLERTLEERLLARENLQRETHILFRELESVKTRLVQAAAAAREQGEMLTQLEQQRTMLERKRDAFHKSIERRRE